MYSKQSSVDSIFRTEIFMLWCLTLQLHLVLVALFSFRRASSLEPVISTSLITSSSLTHSTSVYIFPEHVLFQSEFCATVLYTDTFFLTMKRNQLSTIMVYGAHIGQLDRPGLIDFNCGFTTVCRTTFRQCT